VFIQYDLYNLERLFLLNVSHWPKKTNPCLQKKLFLGDESSKKLLEKLMLCVYDDTGNTQLIDFVVFFIVSIYRNSVIIRDYIIYLYIL